MAVSLLARSASKIRAAGSFIARFARDGCLRVLCVSLASFALKLSLLRHLEEAGGAHAAADAHRADDELGAAPFPLDQRVADHAGARHAIGVADRDRAAVHI